MTDRDSVLIQDIMWRVRFIHTARYLLTPKMIKGIVFLASCVSVLFLVSISHIIENMSHLSSAMEYTPYIFGAYMNTSLLVQSAIVLALAAGAWIARDIISRWSIQRNFAHS